MTTRLKTYTEERDRVTKFLQSFGGDDGMTFKYLDLLVRNSIGHCHPAHPSAAPSCKSRGESDPHLT